MSFELVTNYWMTYGQKTLAYHLFPLMHITDQSRNPKKSKQANNFCKSKQFNCPWCTCTWSFHWCTLKVLKFWIKLIFNWLEIYWRFSQTHKNCWKFYQIEIRSLYNKLFTKFFSIESIEYLTLHYVRYGNKIISNFFIWTTMLVAGFSLGAI